MQVISTRTIMFVNPYYRAKKVIIKAGPGPQDAPDWVKGTVAYAHALKQHVLKEVIVVEAPKVESEEEEAEPVEVPAPVGIKKNGKGRDEK